MTIFPGSIYGGMGRLGVGKQTSAAVPWWLSGGISAANCVAAWQAKGAASLAASYINLANPGTHNLTVKAGATDPIFDTSVGWTFSAALSNGLTSSATTGNDINQTMIIALKSLGVEGCSVFGLYANNVTRIYSGNAWTVMFVGNAYNGGNISYTNLRVLAISGKFSYVDGAQWGAELNPTVFANRKLDIMCGGGSAPYKSGVVTAAAKYNTALSPAQVAALSAAMAAL